MSPHIRRTVRFVALAAWILGHAGLAHAQARPTAAPVAAAPVAGRTPAQAREALAAAAAKAGMTHFAGANGKVKFNATNAAQLHAVESVGGAGSGVLQILQFSGNMHTVAIFENKLVHFQYATGTNNWRLRSWGDRLRESDHKMYGAMIQLTPAEAEKLRARLNGMYAEEGTEQAAGAGWANGHIKQMAGNCASGWCSIAVGDHGESLGALVGVGINGSPPALQRALETNGNDRVFGIGVYGPAVPDFGARPDVPVVQGN